MVQLTVAAGVEVVVVQLTTAQQAALASSFSKQMQVQHEENLQTLRYRHGDGDASPWR
jgi:hypothetical protein